MHVNAYQCVNVHYMNAAFQVSGRTGVVVCGCKWLGQPGGLYGAV